MSDALRDADDVRAWLAVHVYAPRPGPDQVGLEAELFPFWMADGDRPAARLALVEIVGIVDGIADATRNPAAAHGRPSWQLGGALLVEEPGAQVEVAGPPQPDAGTAIDELEVVIDRLVAAFDGAGAGLAAAGLDCWSEPGQVPVQLEVPRYAAMATYFARRDAAQGDGSQGASPGRLLMCASCSLQINVDLGPPDVARRRWLLANLAAPVLTAAFAASPLDAVVNGNALGWRTLDPTRTGVPPPLVAGSDDPLEHVLADALRADVLLVDRDGNAFPGTPGWTFGDWVADGHPRYGPPTTADLALHLTTLFPEARLRGYLEVRGVDELPRPWRGAAVALVVGLLYDDEAREQALDLLEAQRAAIPALLLSAAEQGLADPVLGPLAIAVLDAGLAGAERLGIPQGAAASAFLDTFTRRGRHPSDDLRAALADGPAAGFRWARC